MRKRNQWSQILALSMAAALAVTGLDVPAYGMSEADGGKEAVLAEGISSIYDGYSLKWEENFDGTTLDETSWNVEAHEPGWVNEELQEYPDAEDALGKNIIVKDGKLTIKPVKTEKANAGGNQDETIKGNVLKGSGFEKPAWDGGAGGDGEGSVTFEDGKAVVDIQNAGTATWHMQLYQNNITLTQGHTYTFKVKAKADKPRSVLINLLDPERDYAWYGGGQTYTLGTQEQEITFEVNVDGQGEAGKERITSDSIQLQFALGKLGDTEADFADATVEFYDVSFVDLNEPITTGLKYQDFDFTSGRINTENKHNFTYGLFEARAKVPEGKGYLPAFWLMAANESADDAYGVWPTCGEIDMMEVLGDDTDTLHGTIHYGNPHQQNQGTYKNTVSGNSFSDEFHVFQCEWEPGKITWYVDGEEYYSTSNWYSTSDDGRTLTYPAPFDHDMYVILNLAVGNEWAGYPDSKALEDMENQDFQIDYVKVYQKDSYDEDVVEPEKPVDTSLRQPVNGNYVYNGDFSEVEDLNKLENVTEDEQKWVFLTDKGGVGSATISGNEILITTEDEGTVDYSIQLVQAGLPLETGKKYRISFEACASEARSMQYAVQNTSSWNPYTGAHVIDLTTEYQTFSSDFNMYRDTDSSARIDFNMGKFESVADIRIKNVALTCIGDADAEEVDDTKYPRNDGNRVYNGGFEEGENRLGSWNIKKDDASTLSVTNGAKDGKRVRQLIVNASEAVSEKNPLVLSQEILLDTGFDYELRMDAKAAGDVKLSVADINETVSANKEMTSFSKVVTFKDTKNTIFAITITKPGQYVLDNVFFGRVAIGLIRNGDFTDYRAAWVPFTDSSATAKVSFKEQEAKIDVEKIGSQDWHIQLNQDNIKLEKGKKYKLSFQAKASTDRKIKVTLQENGGDWKDYSGALLAELTDTYQTFEKEFTMTHETDAKSRFNIAAGVINGEAVSGKHTIWVDDVSLVEVVKKDDSKTEESKTEETKKEEPKTEQPKTEEPKTEQPGTEEPKTQDPSKSNHDGKVQKGETAVTEDGVATAISAKEASFAAADTFNKKSFVIPDQATIDTRKVPITKIEKSAFAGKSSLTSVTIGKNVKTVESEAFKDCKKLKKIKIYAKKLKKIKKKAFAGCPNKKSTRVTIYAKNRNVFNKVVKQMKKAGLKKATYKFKKMK
ncbi:MAG: carbohydrate binding domain-containing protein [Lachnospiraceae bacterium]|nr:carbohydrate binding domain-containing protein [Lachnospiraceae bacterium]